MVMGSNWICTSCWSRDELHHLYCQELLNLEVLYLRRRKRVCIVLILFKATVHRTGWHRIVCDYCLGVVQCGQFFMWQYWICRNFIVIKPSGTHIPLQNSCKLNVVLPFLFSLLVLTACIFTKAVWCVQVVGLSADNSGDNLRVIDD